MPLQRRGLTEVCGTQDGSQPEVPPITPWGGAAHAAARPSTTTAVRSAQAARDLGTNRPDSRAEQLLFEAILHAIAHQVRPHLPLRIPCFLGTCQAQPSWLMSS